MAFTIPNLADATYAKQARPDAGDIVILAAGYNRTGVVTGCEVTAQGTPDMTVAVASGSILVANATVSVTGGNVTITASDATNDRIDLIAVNASGTKSAVAGTAAANPVYPAIPASSVILAAVYVQATATSIATANIVDKRVILLPAVVTGSNTGDQTERAASSTTPAAIGTAAVGTGTTDARADHVHATGAGTPSTQAFGDVAAIGTGPAAAMTDHKHAMMAAPTTVSGNAGTATKLATARAINGVDFDGTAPITVTADANTLSGTTLKSTVVTSSLTSVGTLASPILTTPDINGGTADSLTSLGVRSTGAAYDLKIASAEVLTAEKTLTINVGDTSRTLTLGTSPSVSGSNTGDQTLPVKASGAELDTATDDAKFATAKALKDSHNVPSVAPSTSGNVLTSNGTDWTSAAPAAGGTPTEMIWATTFETAGRFNLATDGGASNTFNTTGLAQDTSATITSSAKAYPSVFSGNGQIELGSPSFSILLSLNTAGTDFKTFAGLGNVTVAGADITYTTKQIGFKIARAASGAINLYGTQADGTTEAATAALTSLAEADEVDLILKVNAAASVDYYWRKNSSALSAATNLTGHMPSGATGILVFAVSNVGVATQSKVYHRGCSYRR